MASIVHTFTDLDVTIRVKVPTGADDSACAFVSRSSKPFTVPALRRLFNWLITRTPHMALSAHNEFCMSATLIYQVPPQARSSTACMELQACWVLALLMSHFDPKAHPNPGAFAYGLHAVFDKLLIDEQ